MLPKSGRRLAGKEGNDDRDSIARGPERARRRRGRAGSCPPAGPPSTQRGRLSRALCRYRRQQTERPPRVKTQPRGGSCPANRLGKGNPHYRKLAENRTAFLSSRRHRSDSAAPVAAQLLRQASPRRRHRRGPAVVCLRCRASRRSRQPRPGGPGRIPPARRVPPMLSRLTRRATASRPAYAVVLAGDSMAADGESLYRLIDRLKAEEEKTPAPQVRGPRTTPPRRRPRR